MAGPVRPAASVGLAKALDMACAAALAAFAVTLALPWEAAQECLPMRPCGPWTEHSGWDVAGGPALVLLLVAAGSLAIPGAAARRFGVAMAATLLALAVAAERTMSWEVFVEVRLQPAAWVAQGASALAAVAGWASAALAMADRRPAAPNNP